MFIMVIEGFVRIRLVFVVNKEQQSSVEASLLNTGYFDSGGPTQRQTSWNAIE